MPEPQTSDMHQINDVSASSCFQLALASCEFYVQTIFSMDIYVKISFISIFYFWFSNMILSDVFILPISQLQTQLVMTSQIRSHIEYLIRTYILVLLLVVEIDEKSSLNGGF